MTLDEFFKFYEYLQQIFDIKSLTDTLAEVWYKCFQGISENVAYRMVEIYLKNETRRFTMPAQLLAYEQQARQIKQSTFEPVEQQIEQQNICDICDGKGYVGVEYEEYDYPFPVIKYSKCNCDAGRKECVNMAYVNLDTLSNRIKNDLGIYMLNKSMHKPVNESTSKHFEDILKQCVRKVG